MQSNHSNIFVKLQTDIKAALISVTRINLFIISALFFLISSINIKVQTRIVTIACNTLCKTGYDIKSKSGIAKFIVFNKTDNGTFNKHKFTIEQATTRQVHKARIFLCGIFAK